MAAVVARLDPELAGPASIPEPVSGPIGGRSGSNRSFPGGVVFRSLPTGARPELENPECHRADPVPVLVGVEGLGSHEVSNAQTGGLLLGDLGQGLCSGQEMTRPEETVVGVGGIGGYHADEAGVVEELVDTRTRCVLYRAFRGSS